MGVVPLVVFLGGVGATTGTKVELNGLLECRGDGLEAVLGFDSAELPDNLSLTVLKKLRIGRDCRDRERSSE